MVFALVFLANAAASFALSLVVAGLVGPEAFGRYAIGLAVAVVATTVGFEWLRLATIRFLPADPAARSAAPATLRRAYLVAAGGLAVATTIVLAVAPDAGPGRAIVAAAVAAGIAIGLFDGRVAVARARFRDRRVAALLLARGLLAFALAAGAAALTRDPAAILVASGVAALVALAAMPEPRPAGAEMPADRASFAAFARYGLPLVAASAALQLLPLLNRAILAERSGYVEAAHFALAGEIAARLFQNLGAALDLVLFQLAIRDRERLGSEAGAARASRNLALVAAVVLPAAAGLCAVWPSFAGVFVPETFRGRIDQAALLAVPAFAASAILLYGLNPLLLLERRAAPLIAAAVAALAVDGLLLALLPALLPRPLDAVSVAAVQFAGFGAALAILGAFVLRAGLTLPWRDLAGATVASGVMAAALWPWREALPPASGLAAQIAAGTAIYAAAAWTLDVAGARAAAAALMRRMRGRA